MPILVKEVKYLKINETLILDCLNELYKNAQAKQKYKDYYEGNHDILKNYQMQDNRSNMKLVFNYPRKFVDNEVGYILGKPVNYISKSDNEDIINAIDLNINVIKSRQESLEEFDEGIFNALVEKIDVISPTHFIFELKSGMRVDG